MAYYAELLSCPNLIHQREMSHRIPRHVSCKGTHQSDDIPVYFACYVFSLVAITVMQPFERPGSTARTTCSWVAVHLSWFCGLWTVDTGTAITCSWCSPVSPYENLMPQIVLLTRLSSYYLRFSLCRNNCMYKSANLLTLSLMQILHLYVVVPLPTSDCFLRQSDSVLV